MLRPFYKSRLLWLGLPGLVFLLWVWWDSGVHYSVAMWGVGKREGFVFASTGYVGWLSGTNDAHSPGRRNFEVHREVLPMAGATRWAGRFYFAPAFQREDMTYRAGGVVAMGMRVGMWVMVLGYVMVWLGAVWWWQRRKVRLMRGVAKAGDGGDGTLNAG